MPVDSGLLFGSALANALTSGIQSYRDAQDRDLLRKDREEEKLLKKKAYQAGLLEHGFVENPEGGFDLSPMEMEKRKQASDEKNQERMIRLFSALPDDEKPAYYNQLVKSLAGSRDGLIKGPNQEVDTPRGINKSGGEPVLNIRKFKNNPGQKAADIAFGKEYAEYEALGGRQNVELGIKKLENIKEQLGKKGSSLTGGWRNAINGGIIQKSLNPEGVKLKQDVDTVFNPLLKQVFGAQMTDNERKAFINSHYDDQLPPEQNVIKMVEAIEELRSRADAKDVASEYFKRHGTLAGFKPLGSIKKDIAPKNEGIISPNSKPKTVIQNGHTYTLNEETGQYE